MLDMHWKLLQDQRRLSAFERALQAVMTPDSIVLDLGCGTGILGLLACRAGARHVYALDVAEILGAAMSIARATADAHRITHVRGHYGTASIPDAVDLIVGDQMGPLGFEADLITMYSLARHRFLRAEGTLIPGRVDTWIAPATSPVVRASLRRWTEPIASFDLSALRAYEGNGAHEVTPEEVTTLADGQCAATLFPGLDQPATTRSVDLTFTIRGDGTMDGLCGWFVAELAVGIMMTNRPDDPLRVARRAALLPIDRAIEVLDGDRVHVRFGVRPALNLVEWRGHVERDGATVASFAHSTLPAVAAATSLQGRS